MNGSFFLFHIFHIVSLGTFLYLEIVDIRQGREKRRDAYPTLSLLRMSAVSFYESLCANRCNLININSLVALPYKECLSDTRGGVMT